MASPLQVKGRSRHGLSIFRIFAHFLPHPSMTATMFATTTSAPITCRCRSRGRQSRGKRQKIFLSSGLAGLTQAMAR
jgi:hypothetical protein